MKTLRCLDADGTTITFDVVAREAGVSRSWLYAHADIRDEIDRMRQRRQPAASTPTIPHRQRASDASLLRRLEAATERIRRLEQDNRELRDALAAALGEQRVARIIGARPTRDTPGTTARQIIGQR